jgi:hypothetical protein
VGRGGGRHITPAQSAPGWYATDAYEYLHGLLHRIDDQLDGAGQSSLRPGRHELPERQLNNHLQEATQVKGLVLPWRVGSQFTAQRSIMTSPESRHGSCTHHVAQESTNLFHVVVLMELRRTSCAIPVRVHRFVVGLMMAGRRGT